MKVKTLEHNKAIELRSQGVSIKDIAKILCVSKGSVSTWVRGIELTDEQKEYLHKKATCGNNSLVKFNSNNTLREDNCRKQANNARINRIEKAREEADNEWKIRKQDPDFMFGLALYIGEGSKEEFSIKIINYDPKVIVASIRFFLKLGIPKEDIKVNIALHEGRSELEAKKFWMSLLEVSDIQFRKTWWVPVKPNRKKNCNHVYGGCQISVNNTHLKRKLMRWIELALLK